MIENKHNVRIYFTTCTVAEAVDEINIMLNQAQYPNISENDLVSTTKQMNDYEFAFETTIPDTEENMAENFKGTGLSFEIIPEVYTSKEVIVKKIIAEYNEHDTELNASFFDFNVNMTVKDIMETYAYIQMKINGDTVVCLRDIEISSIAPNSYVWGYEQENPYETTDKTYNGNLKDFLEQFVGKEIDRGWCRISELAVRHDDKMGGIKLDFIL